MCKVWPKNLCNSESVQHLFHFLEIIYLDFELFFFLFFFALHRHFKVAIVRIITFPFALLLRLAELITRRIVKQKLSRVLSNIVIGSVQLRKSGFEGKTCNVFFDKKNPAFSQEVTCGRQRSKVSSITIVCNHRIRNDVIHAVVYML